MTDTQAQRWMKQFAAETPAMRMPDADLLWARARLEAEFARRSKPTAPLIWMRIAMQTAGVVALAATVAGLVGV
jgi:fatty acid desaturase